MDFIVSHFLLAIFSTRTDFFLFAWLKFVGVLLYYIINIMVFMVRQAWMALNNHMMVTNRISNTYLNIQNVSPVLGCERNCTLARVACPCVTLWLINISFVGDQYFTILCLVKNISRLVLFVRTKISASAFNRYLNLSDWNMRADLNPQWNNDIFPCESFFWKR
jgi:hypothetical protein